MRGAPMLSAIGDDGVARTLNNICGDETLRSLDQIVDLVGTQIGDFAKRIDAGHKADLGLEDIANAGQHILMQ